MKCVNLGCGMTPVEGWINYDNSISIRLAKIRVLVSIMQRFGLLNSEQRSFIAFARKKSNIRFADVCTRIPEEDHSIDVLYTSHMLEHLDAKGVAAFLAEARRVLKPGGHVRIAVPNLRYHVDNYLQTGDADGFMNNTGLSRRPALTILSRVWYLFVGDRSHKHMYDGASLCDLLGRAGFRNVRDMPPGETTIPQPDPLDLRERYPESVFVEAVSP